MKFSKKLGKAAGSAQIVILAIMLFALVLVVLFYPKASWVHLTVGSIFILVIEVVLIASQFKDDEQIISKTGEVPPNDPDDPA